MARADASVVWTWTATPIILATLALAATTRLARADLLWDNGDWDSWDFGAGTSSERNTEVSESWIIDDFVLTEPVALRELEWLALRPIGFDPVAADCILLTSEFDTIVEYFDHAFTSDLKGIGFGHEVHELTIHNLDIELAPGRYYTGARFVGDGTGRSWAAGQNTIRGVTQAYIRSDFLGYPDWEPAPGGYDAVFKVYGDIIPAPATLVFALPCLLALRRRR